MARDWDRQAAEAAAAEERELQAKLAAALAPWIEQHGIASGETAAKIAASIAECGAEPSGLTLIRADLLKLDKTGEGSQLLRDAAIALAATAEVDPAELAWDNYVHGHGHPPGYLGRPGELVND